MTGGGGVVLVFFSCLSVFQRGGVGSCYTVILRYVIIILGVSLQLSVMNFCAFVIMISYIAPFATQPKMQPRHSPPPLARGRVRESLTGYQENPKPC